MSQSEHMTTWKDLHERRREVLQTIDGEYDYDDTFARSDVDSHLGDDDNTTTRTLNRLDEEDNYLNRVATGGGPLLVAQREQGEDRTASRPPAQEDLAREMVNEENLPLTPENYDWAEDDSRNAFAAEFNQRASNTTLRPTWTRNRYELVEGAKNEIQQED
jgi:hypothetical protein